MGGCISRISVRIASWCLFDLGIIPDFVTRFFLRWMCFFWVRQLDCGGDIEKKMSFKHGFVEKLKNSPVAIETAKANEQHYEVPSAFYVEVLGPRLKYSSGYWPKGVSSLEESENAMLALVCQRAGVLDGHVVLDLGCGWGATALYLCEHYPRSKIVAVSNSASQAEYIREQARIHSFKNIEVKTCDANILEMQPHTFDRIISVEMFEHMRNYRVLMNRISTWLKPDGRLFVHILSHREYAYPMVAKSGSDSWMAREFFTGGIMPSDDLLLYFQEDMCLTDHWRIKGTHYMKTLNAWLDMQDKKKKECLEIFESAYGPNEKKSKFLKWRMFFLMCAECFGFRNGNEWMVSHYTFSPRRV